MTGYIKHYGWQGFKMMIVDRNPKSYIDSINRCYCQAIDIG